MSEPAGGPHWTIAPIETPLDVSPPTNNVDSSHCNRAVIKSTWHHNSLANISFLFPFDLVGNWYFCWWSQWRGSFFSLYGSIKSFRCLSGSKSSNCHLNPIMGIKRSVHFRPLSTRLTSDRRLRSGMSAMVFERYCCPKYLINSRMHSIVLAHSTVGSTTCGKKIGVGTVVPAWRGVDWLFRPKCQC